MGYATDSLLNSSAVGLSTHNANWTDPFNSFATIASNGGLQSVEQAVRIAYQNTGTFADAQYAEIELVDPSGGSDYIGPAVRCSDTGSGVNGYWFYAALGAGRWFWGYMVNGSYTALDNNAGYTTGWAAGDILRIEVSGTTVKLLRNGVDLNAPNTTNRTECGSGRPGLCGYHNSAGTGTNGKNWVGGDLDRFRAWDYAPDVQQLFHNQR